MQYTTTAKQRYKKLFSIYRAHLNNRKLSDEDRADVVSSEPMTKSSSSLKFIQKIERKYGAKVRAAAQKAIWYKYEEHRKNAPPLETPLSDMGLEEFEEYISATGRYAIS
jgi:hypothetical protein